MGKEGAGLITNAELIAAPSTDWIDLDSMVKTLGDKEGHEFHGNQWGEFNVAPRIPWFSSMEQDVGYGRTENASKINRKLIAGEELSSAEQKMVSDVEFFQSKYVTENNYVLYHGGTLSTDKAINSPAFLSTATDRENAKHFGREVVAIYVPKGTHVAYGSSAEQERILPRDGRLTPTGKTSDGTPILQYTEHPATRQRLNELARVRKERDDEEMRGLTLFDTTEAEHHGVLVSLHLDLATAKKLSVKGGEDPEQMHITLCYCGDVDEIGDVNVARAIVAVNQIVQAHAPLQGTTTELGSFDATEHSDDKDVMIAHVDIPGIFELQQQLVDALTAVDAPPRANFEYTPHITLAYVAIGDDVPVENIPTLPLMFTEVRITIGEQTTDIPFGQAPRNLAGWMRYLLERMAGDKPGHEFTTK